MNLIVYEPGSKFCVEYDVLGKHMKVGPYANLQEAGTHLQDIAGYEGVTNTKIVPVPPCVCVGGRSRNCTAHEGGDT